jgi:hypothetical protein
MPLAWVRTVALTVCLASGSAIASAEPHSTAPLPKLEILTKASLTSRQPPPTGATLVASSLSEKRRQKLATTLRALLSAQAKRNNPFYVSLDDQDTRAELQQLLADTGPMFTAAAALAAGRWQSAEADMILRPVSRCPARALCRAAFGDGPDDDLGRRARFLAWPLGYAVLLRLGSAAEAAQIADRLRERPTPTQVALVLSGTELHGVRQSPALREVTTMAASLLRRQPDLPFADLLRNLATVGSAGNELPWLRLGKETVLVVPRLGSLATADRFVEEVRTLLGDTPVEWLAAPR